MNAIKVTKSTIALFVLPCLILYVIMVISPIFLSAYYSLMEWSGVGAPLFVGLQNYTELFWNDPIFWPAFYRTLLFALFSVIEIPFTLLIAILLSRYVRKPNFLVSSYFMPVILSVAVVGQLWKSIYNPAALGGMLNKMLISFGLENWTQEWLANTSLAMYSLIFVALWQFLGYHIIIQFTGVQSIPNDIYEAAKIDGADGFKADRYITLPLVMPVFKISVVLAVIGSLKIFDLIIVMTGGGPANATEVISTYMYNQSFFSYRYGYGSAISTFLVIECLIFTMFLNMLFKRSENSVS
jgi:raffinose/stachyose/melibiose transport system permease protein